MGLSSGLLENLVIGGCVIYAVTVFMAMSMTEALFLPRACLAAWRVLIPAVIALEVKKAAKTVDRGE